jgi:hypothetical protein
MGETFDKRKSAYLQNVNLETLDDTMEFYRQVIQGFTEGHAVSENDLRALVYALRGYLDFLKHKSDLDLENRVEELENLLRSRGYEIDAKAS